MDDHFLINFQYQGKQYSGDFARANGAGDTSTYFLMIDSYYWGTLHMVRDKWVFHSNKNEMEDMAEDFGKFITFLTC